MSPRSKNVIVAFLVVLCTFELFYFMRFETFAFYDFIKGEGWAGENRFVYIIALLIGIWIMAGSLRNFLAPGYILADDSLTKVLSVAENSIVPYLKWGRDKKIYAGLAKEINVGFKPITKNPRLRDILCHVTLYPPKNMDNVLEREKAGKTCHDIEREVKYWLYELSEVFNGELSKFYNPEDKKQQERFSGLVKKFLGEKVNLFGHEIEAEFSIKI